MHSIRKQGYLNKLTCCVYRSLKTCWAEPAMTWLQFSGLMKYLLRSFSLSLIQEWQLSVFGGYPLRGLNLPCKSVVRKTDNNL